MPPTPLHLRLARTSATVLTCAALAFAISGCGGNGGSSDAHTSAGGNASFAASQPGVSTKWTVQSPISPSDEAVAKYGKGDVSAVADKAVGIVKTYAFDETLVNAHGGTDDMNALLALGGQMTSGASKDWMKAVKGYATATPKQLGSDDSISAFTSIALWDVFRDGFISGAKGSAPTSGPTVINRVITGGQVNLLTDGRLKVDVTSSASLRITKTGKPQVWPIDRNLSLFMTKTSDGWKIDGWLGSYTPGKVHAE